MSALRTLHAANASPMTLDGTRTFLVGFDPVAIVDPGPDDAAHLDALVAAVGGAAATIVLTHAHPDHAAGAPALARRIGAPIRSAAAAGADRLADGDVLRTDAGALHVVATPGHTPDHLALHWHDGAAPAGGAVFVGDLLMGEGDTALVAHPEGDLAAYLASLDRIDALGAALLLPTHGPPLADPADALRRYRAHRQARIRQVAEAVAQGEAGLDGLVERVYGDALHPALRGAAAASLLAVLHFLETDRALGRTGGDPGSAG